MIYIIGFILELNLDKEITACNTSLITAAVQYFGFDLEKYSISRWNIFDGN